MTKLIGVFRDYANAPKPPPPKKKDNPVHKNRPENLKQKIQKCLHRLNHVLYYIQEYRHRVSELVMTPAVCIFDYINSSMKSSQRRRPTAPHMALCYRTAHISSGPLTLITSSELIYETQHTTQAQAHYKD